MTKKSESRQQVAKAQSFHELYVLTVKINKCSSEKAVQQSRDCLAWTKPGGICDDTWSDYFNVNKTPSIFLEQKRKKNGEVHFGDTVFKTWAVFFSTTSNHVTAVEQYGSDISGIYTHLLCTWFVNLSEGHMVGII